MWWYDFVLFRKILFSTLFGKDVISENLWHDSLILNLILFLFCSVTALPRVIIVAYGPTTGNNSGYGPTTGYNSGYGPTTGNNSGYGPATGYSSGLCFECTPWWQSVLCSTWLSADAQPYHGGYTWPLFWYDVLMMTMIIYAMPKNILNEIISKSSLW